MKLKPQQEVQVTNRTIKLPNKSAPKNDLMANLLSELLDEAGSNDDDADDEGVSTDGGAAAEPEPARLKAVAGGAPVDRLKPNTNFLTRLVSSAQRSNRRIIAQVRVGLRVAGAAFVGLWCAGGVQWRGALRHWWCRLPLPCHNTSRATRRGCLCVLHRQRACHKLHGKRRAPRCCPQSSVRLAPLGVLLPCPVPHCGAAR